VRTAVNDRDVASGSYEINVNPLVLGRADVHALGDRGHPPDGARRRRADVVAAARRGRPVPLWRTVAMLALGAEWVA
jgi:hypothetical protein